MLKRKLKERREFWQATTLVGILAASYHTRHFGSKLPHSAFWQQAATLGI
jgi:hypothetical protein